MRGSIRLFANTGSCRFGVSIWFSVLERPPWSVVLLVKNEVVNNRLNCRGTGQQVVRRTCQGDIASYSIASGDTALSRRIWLKRPEGRGTVVVRLCRGCEDVNEYSDSGVIFFARGYTWFACAWVLRIPFAARLILGYTLDSDGRLNSFWYHQRSTAWLGWADCGRRNEIYLSSESLFVNNLLSFPNTPLQASTEYTSIGGPPRKRLLGFVRVCTLNK